MGTHEGELEMILRLALRCSTLTESTVSPAAMASPSTTDYCRRPDHPLCFFSPRWRSPTTWMCSSVMPLGGHFKSGLCGQFETAHFLRGIQIMVWVVGQFELACGIPVRVI